MTALVDLVHVFPSRDAECARDGVVALGSRVSGGRFEAHVKATSASDTTLWFLFHVLSFFEPPLG